MGRVVNRMRAVHPGEVLREEYLAPLSLSVNALAMALHYLRQPDANVPGAARKAVQALAALRSLGSADVGTSPSTQGGAA